ncbi:MAG TPA: glycosyltransferase family 39 protein [Candidatus Krumholzibacteria bacterium]|nr:glycosyltransferase family 39 protein [Candidatus Krumholzibacteria bacterium]
MTPDRRTLLALFALAFGLRVLFAVIFGGNPDVVTIHETYDYQIAARMAQDFNWVTTPFSPNAPGYLILLAAVFSVFGASWWTAVLLNCFLGGMTTFFLYRIGENRFAPRAGLVAAIWLGLFVHQIAFASFVFRDVMVAFLFTWFVYQLCAPFRRMRTAVWLAVLYTLLIMTEPVFLVLLPVLIVYFALFATHHRTLNLQYLFLFAAFFLFMNVPWTVRNYYVHHEFVPVSIEADRYSGPVIRLLSIPVPAQRVEVPPGMVYRQPGFLHNTREFWRVVRFYKSPADPAHAVAAEPAWSLRHNLTSLLTYGLLLPFVVIGVIFAIRKRHRPALILTVSIFAYAFVRGFMTGDDRFRLTIEPLIILMGVFGLRELMRLRGSSRPPAAD